MTLSHSLLLWLKAILVQQRKTLWVGGREQSENGSEKESLELEEMREEGSCQMRKVKEINERWKEIELKDREISSLNLLFLELESPLQRMNSFSRNVLWVNVMCYFGPVGAPQSAFVLSAFVKTAFVDHSGWRRGRKKRRGGLAASAELDLNLRPANTQLHGPLMTSDSFREQKP